MAIRFGGLIVDGGIRFGDLLENENPPVVTDLNTNETAVDGEQGVTFATTGFAAEITSVKIISGLFETDATGVTSTGGSGTFDLPDISALGANAAGAPFTSASHAVTVELSDGTSTASIAITYNPKSGWAVQEITNAVTVQGSVFENFTGTILDTSQALYPTANSTAVSATGIFTTSATSDIDMVFFDVSDGIYKPFAATIPTDVTAPVITRLGSSIVNIELGTTYNDAGATALDETDGDITGSIVTVNPVNINAVGAYTVTYNVQDAASNAAAEVTRTVNVTADVTIPVINLIGSSTVNINLGDAYSDAGASATDNIDGDITGSIVTVNPVNVNSSGSYTVTYNVQDAAGNDAVEVSRTVNVAADTTAPVISLIGPSVVNIEAGNSYSDAGATASDNIDGDITGSIATVNLVNTSVVGPYVVTYNVSDAAGNVAVQVTRTVNVLVDTTLPVITRIGSSPINIEVNSSYSDLGATATDNTDGDITGNITTVNPVNVAIIGQYNITYNVSDAAGNAAAQVTRIVIINPVSSSGNLYLEGAVLKGGNVAAEIINAKSVGEK